MPTKIISVDETYTIRGEAIAITADQRVDALTGEPVFDELLDDQAVQQAFDVYRRRHDVMTAREIVALRNQLGLSQRGFAALLGWSPTTVATYETGALPSEANNQFLHALAVDDQLAATLYRRAATRLSPSDRQAFERQQGVNDPQRIVQHAHQQLDQVVAALFTATNYTEFSGYTSFNLKKFLNVALFFINAMPRLTKTKLNKLLFYTDFKYFAETTTAITGAPYARLNYGPVPDDYALLYGLMEAQALITTALVTVGTHEWEVYEASREFDSAVFSEAELAVMQQVLTRFETSSAGAISEVSHSEPAWRETPPSAHISYLKAAELIGL